MFLRFTAAVVLATTFTSTLALAAPPSHAQTGVKVVPDFTVFFDPPTGFVFVKLPTGWKFVGKAEPREGAVLAAGVVTSLLDPLSDVPAELDARIASER